MKQRLTLRITLFFEHNPHECVQVEKKKYMQHVLCTHLLLTFVLLFQPSSHQLCEIQTMHPNRAAAVPCIRPHENAKGQ